MSHAGNSNGGWRGIGIQLVGASGVVAAASLLLGGLVPLAIVLGLMTFGLIRWAAPAIRKAFGDSQSTVVPQGVSAASRGQGIPVPPPPPDAYLVRAVGVGSDAGLSGKEWTIFTLFFLAVPCACVLISATLYYVWRKEKPRRARQINVLGFAVFGLQCLAYFLIGHVMATAPDVERIKASRLAAFPDVTIGDVIGNYLSTPRWTSVPVRGGRHVFAQGKVLRGDNRSQTARIRFVIEDGQGQFAINGVELGGTALTEDEANVFLAAMFKSAQQRATPK